MQPHPQHQDIDRELLRGEQPLAALARRFRLSEDSLARHRANHLVRAVVPLPEPWLELKEKLMRTLQRYPAALEAVYEAIEG